MGNYLGELEAEEPSGKFGCRGSHLGGFWESSGNLKGIQDAPGRQLGDIWEASGESLGALAGLGDPGAPDGSWKQSIAILLS